MIQAPVPPNLSLLQMLDLQRNTSREKEEEDEASLTVVAAAAAPISSRENAQSDFSFSFLFFHCSYSKLDTGVWNTRPNISILESAKFYDLRQTLIGAFRDSKIVKCSVGCE